MAPESPRTWINLIPLVLILLVIWREAALQLPSATLSVVSPTWPLRGMGVGVPVPESVRGQQYLPGWIIASLEGTWPRLTSRDLVGRGQPPSQIWFPLILLEPYRLPLTSSLAGERGVGQGREQLWCVGETLPLHPASLLTFGV